MVQSVTEPDYAYLLIVRRECEDKLVFLREAFEKRRGVRVIADRRVGERRARRDDVPVDRRRHDRRGPQPPSWDIADYLLVPERPRTRVP
ncbi:MAG: hypothetical protein HYU53_10475 [Acidobacteria bacterium]|nr:hypothetical protein [Acidobacteriota bacterium]